MNKRCIFALCLAALSQLSNCQVANRPSTITTGIIPNNQNTQILRPSGTTNAFATGEVNNAPVENTNSAEPYRVNNKINDMNGRVNGNTLNTNGRVNGTAPNANNQFVNGTEPNSFFNNTANNDPYLNNTTVVHYDKNTNWTLGSGTHYGPFPSEPHFSEPGYQPNDVGIGCSDGRPGGDPKWNAILAKGVYPPPNIINHEQTVWPVTYTVAVAAAVWNKEDICWKKLKIRNKKKPKNVIEAYIVDFCPIGKCLWNKKDLARNVDIYGEKAWTALGGNSGESKLALEIEWPEGVIPHDAIDVGFSKIDKTVMTIIAPLISTLIALYLF